MRGVDGATVSDDDGETLIAIQGASVSLANAGTSEGPSVRLYKSFNGGPDGTTGGGATWCLQIRGGLRSRTPMYASGTITRDALVALRDALDEELADRCSVGCGECDECARQNAAAQVAYAAANPIDGELVQLMPMSAAAREWAKEYTTNARYVVKMISRVGETFSVRAAGGRTRSFGPLDATWVRHMGTAADYARPKRRGKVRP